jgi:regulator of sigma E protease
MTVIATLIVLGVLIFVHELGHFWAARSVGIRVDRFSIGLGPRIYGFRRGDTEYIISAIPLGGYVKMAGMDDEMMEAIEGGKVEGSAEAEAVASVGRDELFDAKPVWARAWVISAGVIMNFLFAFVAYAVVAGAWGSAEPDTVRVGEVRAEILPVGTEALLGIPAGAYLQAVGEVRPDHWGEVQRAFMDLPAGPVDVRFARTSDGREGLQTASVTLPEAAEARIQILRGLDYWIDPVVGDVTPGSPAARAGIRGGDRMISVEGEPIERWVDFTRAIQARPEQPTTLVIIRDGAQESLLVTPDAVDATDPLSGEVRTIGRVGLLPQPLPIAWERLSPSEAIVYGARQTWGLSVFILDFLRQLVTGQASPRNLGSIVTIGEASGQAAQEGLPVFLSFMALLSINLAILNLLPIPILDGGHLVFLALEAIRGRPVSMEQRARWSQVGFVILIGIMILALGNDFLRLFGF